MAEKGRTNIRSRKNFIIDSLDGVLEVKPLGISVIMKKGPTYLICKYDKFDGQICNFPLKIIKIGSDA
jgi:hypothetical protein